jgi:hypothetical protein
MSDALKQHATDWLNKRMDAMLATPQMWGEQQAVELQFLQLLETDVMVTNADLDAKEPRFVLNKYAEHCRKRFKTAVLYASSYHLDWMELTGHLKEFRASLKGTY